MEFRLSTRVRLFLLTFALRFSAFLTDSLTVSHVFLLGFIDLIDCELSSNHKSGISCNDLGSFVKADSSVISTNDDAAVDIDYAATVKVHDCVLHGNDMFGVRVNGERSEVFLTNNEIHENEIGIWGWRGAVINVAENSITHNLRSDFEIEVRFCLCLPVCAHVALLCFVCVLYRAAQKLPLLLPDCLTPGYLISYYVMAGLPDAGLLRAQDGCRLNETAITHTVPMWAGLKQRRPRPRSRYTRPNSANLPMAQSIPNASSPENKHISKELQKAKWEERSRLLGPLSLEDKATPF